MGALSNLHNLTTFQIRKQFIKEWKINSRVLKNKK